MTEYAVIIALVAVLLIGALVLLGGRINDSFRRTGEDVERPEVFTPPTQCDSNYSGACVPAFPPDLDCSDLRGLGIPLPVRVVGGDPHDIDPDGDGLGCSP